MRDVNDLRSLWQYQRRWNGDVAKTEAADLSTPDRWINTWHIRRFAVPSAGVAFGTGRAGGAGTVAPSNRWLDLQIVRSPVRAGHQPLLINGGGWHGDLFIRTDPSSP